MSQLAIYRSQEVALKGIVGIKDLEKKATKVVDENAVKAQEAAAKKAGNAFEASIKRNRALAKKEYEMNLKRDELRLLNGKINERQYQEGKFEMATQYAAYAIEEEMKLGKNAN